MSARSWKYETTAERDARKRFDNFYIALNNSEPAKAAHQHAEISTKFTEHYLSIAQENIKIREYIPPRPLTV